MTGEPELRKVRMQTLALTQGSRLRHCLRVISRFLICSSLLGKRIYPTGYCPIDRRSEVPIRFNVFVRKNAKHLPVTDVNVKVALSLQLF